MNRKLSYRKRSGIRELGMGKTEKSVVPHQGVVPMSETQQQIPSAYRKEDGMLSYSLICVISGGTKRERTFLNELERKHAFKAVDVIFVSTEEGAGGLTPQMMLSAFGNICGEGIIHASGRNFRLDAVDLIYMFTDVDHYENELKEILKDSGSNAPMWIISNPSFEIWLYYCYHNNPYVDLKGVLSEIPSQRSSMLKTVNGRFNNGGGLDPRMAFERMEDGIAHSKEHYQEVDGIPVLLSTQMHVFAEDVMLRLGNEYQEFVRRQREFREEMRGCQK